MRPAVFLDRDGILTVPVRDPATGLYGAPRRPEDVALLEGAPDALRLLEPLGVPIVVVSNQPDAAKGQVSLESLRAVHREFEAKLQDLGIRLTSIRYCFHHPDGTDPALGRPCSCRKPAPGLILDAARDLGIDLPISWMIGDSDVDIEAGRRAGCKTILVEEPRSEHRRSGPSFPEIRARSVLEAAAIAFETLQLRVPGAANGRGRSEQ